jgi:type IV fimbrial biogenesis protein FimT
VIELERSPNEPTERGFKFASGFTLVELLVALAIGGVVLLLALPTYRTWIAELEVQDRVNALVNAMSLARSEAIKRGARVNLCQSTDGSRCAGSGGWETGWLIYAEHDRDGEIDPAESLIRVEPSAKPGITISGNKPVAEYVSYTRMGHTRMHNGALQMGTFTVCRHGHSAVEVVLANGGRVRVDRTKLPCP